MCANATPCSRATPPSRVITVTPRSAIRSRLTNTCPVRLGVAVAEGDDGLDHLLHRLDLVVADHVADERPRRPRSCTAARGSTVLTRTPVPHSSCASPLVMRFSAAFDAPYIADGGGEAVDARTAARPSLPVALETLTIQPSPALEHRGQRGLREVERRVHVHLERDASPLQRQSSERLRVHRRGRVVDEDVDRPAELLRRPRARCGRGRPRRRGRRDDHATGLP